MASGAGHRFRLLDVGGVIGAVGLTATFIYSTVRHTRMLYKAEPRPVGIER
jgi:hypothetical protein